MKKKFKGRVCSTQIGRLNTKVTRRSFDVFKFSKSFLDALFQLCDFTVGRQHILTVRSSRKEPFLLGNLTFTS